MRYGHSKLFFWGLAITVAYVSMGPVIFGLFRYTPEPFMSLGILDGEYLTNNYFTNEQGAIEINETINWNIHITNNPSKTQYLLLRVKLAETDADLPDSVNCEPCPSPPVHQVWLVLGRNSTVINPFTWSVSGTTKDNDLIHYNKLIINGEELVLDLSIPENQDMRMVFELWVFDSSSNEFSFKWVSRGEPQCIWNYLRFRLET